MASSARVFTEFWDGNWRAPCLSTLHFMGVLFQFSLIWKLNFTLSICFLALKNSHCFYPFLVFVLSSFFIKDLFTLMSVGFELEQREASGPCYPYFVRTELLPASLFLALKPVFIVTDIPFIFGCRTEKSLSRHATLLWTPPLSTNLLSLPHPWSPYLF